MLGLVDQNIVEKGWGWEIILHNTAEYCAKILRFKKGGRFSMHFHMLKNETWYVNEGEFDLYYFNTDTAELKVERLVKGMIVDVDRGSPHQLVAIIEGEIFEASTQHFDNDSYRIVKGDSQNE